MKSTSIIAIGIPSDLLESDVRAIFAQFGEITNLILARDEDVENFRGNLIITYDTRRSAEHAVDKLNGSQILNRTIRVELTEGYHKKDDERDETVEQRSEEKADFPSLQIGEFTRSSGFNIFQNDKLHWRPRESSVLELVESLESKRLLREVTLSLRTSLRDARAEFSFLRLRGLRSLLNFLRSVSHSDSSIALFCKTQKIPDLQVVPVLFNHSLKKSEEDSIQSLDHIFGLDPISITIPSTDAEVAVALRVLEGCCLLHRESTTLAHKHQGIQVLMRILSNRGVLEQDVCLDALIAMMLDSPPNQTDFDELNGIDEVASLIRDKKVEEKLRLKCGEFLLLLVGHVNGRERSPMASVNEDLRRLLGERSASLIWAASQFGSNLGSDQRLTALQIQARRVIESLDL